MKQYKYEPGYWKEEAVFNGCPTLDDTKYFLELAGYIHLDTYGNVFDSHMTSYTYRTLDTNLPEFVCLVCIGGHQEMFDLVAIDSLENYAYFVQDFLEHTKVQVYNV